MNKESLYRMIKLNNKDSLVFVQVGNFYKSYDIDALMLWYMFRYNVINRCASFPLFSLDKVRGFLNGFRINYVLVRNEKEIIYYEVNNNRYLEYASLSEEKYNMYLKIKDLKNNLEYKIEKNNDNYDKIKKFLDKL